MRFSVICVVFVFLSTFGAAAQTNDASRSSAHPTVAEAERDHPEWFKETYTYRPCPAAVVFGDEHHACLGLPTIGHHHGKVKHAFYRAAVPTYSYYNSGSSCAAAGQRW